MEQIRRARQTTIPSLPYQDIEYVAISDQQLLGDQSDEQRDGLQDFVEVEHKTNFKIRKSDFGAPTYGCKHCGAIVWYQEKTANSTKDDPEFSICCSGGNVQLPLLMEPPEYLKTLLDYNGGRQSAKFRKNIMTYNSMFGLQLLNQVLFHSCCLSSSGKQISRVDLYIW